MSSANVLSAQYVDIVARGLEETLRGLRQLQGQADTTGGSMRKLKDDIRTANGAQAGRGGGGGGGGLAGALGLGPVKAALAQVAVALAPVVALLHQGFSGTVEIEQFGLAVTQIGRELAAFFAPALRLATDLMNGLTAVFRGTGVAGQLLLGRISPLGMALEVLANPAVQGSLRGLLSAFGELATALQPLLNVLANVGTLLLKAFVVEPLVGFVRALTFVVLLVKEIAARLSPLLAGFGTLTNAPAGSRREVRLNQTGTEDANGTFQRIQQAVLRASSGDRTEEEKQTSELGEIKEKVASILDKFDGAIAGIAGVIAAVQSLGSSPNQLAEGSKLGLNVLGGALGSFFKR